MVQANKETYRSFFRFSAMDSNYDKLITELNTNKNSIIRKLKKRENDTSRYFYITAIYSQNKPVSGHTEFREIYKSFYVMRAAGLSQQHFDKYFELLDRRIDNLETILNELYVIKTLKQQNSLQFSFATKLLHTLDNNLPIYDNQVKKTLRLPDPYSYSDSHYRKMKSVLSYYENLKKVYQQLLGKEPIKKLIKDIREYLGWTEDKINDVKILDFILWVHSQKE